MTILDRLFRRPEGPDNPQIAARHLYGAAVRQARAPELFGPGGVPDTVEGRFEALALHGFLILHRLKSEGAAGRALAQAYFDTMFEDMDRNLREIGIGDLSVGKRIKLLAENFYGRIKSYEDGLDDGTLEAAIGRNLLSESAAGTSTGASPYAAAVAAYVRREVAGLAAQPFAELAAGRISFGKPPEHRP
ncbi:MAG: ubiquinol-cytochrome C chaperone family protein [Gemmatimonas sp.]